MAVAHERRRRRGAVSFNERTDVQLFALSGASTAAKCQILWPRGYTQRPLSNAP